MLWINVPYPIHNLQMFFTVPWTVFSLSPWCPLMPQSFSLG